MNRVAVWLVCLALVVCAMARRGGGGFKGGFSFGKGSSTGSKGTSTGNRGGSKTGGTHPKPANYPRQPQVPNQNPPPYPGTGGGHAGSFPGRGGAGGNPGQGGYPGQGRYPGQGSYPGQAPGAGSYPNSNPGRGGALPYPKGGSYPGYPVRGASYPGSNPNQYGGAAGAAQYPYWNPNNKIISPGYGGNYGRGYGSYGAGGSPFAQSVHNMGMGPSLQSKGFGKQAMMAAGVGAMAGMAVGYGLGSFPRPHFSFHNPLEEYYYNHYMSRRYGTRTSDSNRDPSSPGIGQGDSGSSSTNIFQNLPPSSYDKYMDSCMKRTDLLQDRNERAAEDSWPQEVEDSEKGLTEDDPNEPLSGKPVGEAESQGADLITGNENTGEGNKTTNATDSPLPFAEKLTAGTEPPTEPQEKMNEEEEDDDTVSILEIGYPALIEQLKARRCLELYVVYAERHAEKQVLLDGKSGGEQLMPFGLMVISLLMTSLLFY